MSIEKKQQFGDKDCNYNLVKVGDKDAQGETIVSIFYTAKSMIIYRTQGNFIISYSNYANRFSVINLKRQEINNLLLDKVHQKTDKNKTIDQDKELESLYAYYAPQLAHAYQMCYFKEYEEALLSAEKVKDTIESKIILQAQYTYSKCYLRPLLYVIGVALVLIIWNELAIQETFKTPKWLLWHFYIATAGIIGSFISAKEKIANQSIDFKLPINRINLDIRLRLLLGGIFGIVTFWLVYSGMITGLLKNEIPQTFFDPKNHSPLQIITALLIGLIGGFSERIVPDTLITKFDKPSKEKKEEDIKKTADTARQAETEE